MRKKLFWILFFSIFPYFLYASPNEQQPSTIGNILKIIILIAIIGSLIYAFIHGMKLQKSSLMNIFVDYTDALLTSLGVLCICVTESSSVFAVLGIALLFFPMKSAFIYNPSISTAFLSIMIRIIAPLTFLFLYFRVRSNKRGVKKDHETDRDFFERQSLADAEESVMHGAIIGSYFLFLNKATRIHKFTSEIFNMSFTNRFQPLMLAAAEQAADVTPPVSETP
jgi:hypothetical protein